MPDERSESEQARPLGDDEAEDRVPPTSPPPTEPEPLDALDLQEIAEAEAEGMTHADMGLPPEEELPEPAAKAPSASSEGGHLEETVLPSTVENYELQPGTTHTWGPLTFQVASRYLGSWITATDGENRLLVGPRHDGRLLASLDNHRLLPRLVYAGPEGTVLEALDGKPIGRNLPLRAALEVVQPLAQLVYFLERKGLALLDLEPHALQQTPQGLKLTLPPRLGRIGEPPPRVWRQGYTPPEVLAEAPLSGKSGVYLLGALWFELLTGTPLPVEGPSELLLSGIPLPGVPQALAQMLAPLDERATPKQALALLQKLSRPGEVEVLLEFGEATSVGLNPSRHYNQDAYAYRLERIQSEFGRTLLLRACVSDGMGGMAAGERASQAAVETFIAGDQPHPLDDPQAQSDWGVRLVWAANQAVLEALAGLDGGCTLSGVILWGARYTVAHVGDTRIYLWRSGQLQQLTRDHSLVAALVASQMITREEAMHHPDRNQVLRSLGNLRQPQEGYVETLEATTGQVSGTLEPGAALVLLSDGVWGEVTEAQMAEILSQAASPQAAAEALVQRALEAGAPDNAAALIIRRRI
ncbi:MAG: protein phosphatase 2C domain-containing protein [Meiothermus sp.]|uniref:protein phosphatase 2C domain-containing protein n=1 Tax=Meiothermus sp. TaxID=1955249 RepID=UPI00298F242C|nr:protein phosphatase 2C domain-containing protein [Meiothermus sp.]MDW8426746.1 protein phosphatase 2C domain-containing protein [Meiothermus sp.]